MSHRYDTLDVAVRGGDLRVGRWSVDGVSAADAPPVVAVHGVTANHLAWAGVAGRSDRTFLAPDLRGRGRSSALSGPAGMGAHVADLVAVLDHQEVDRAIVVGHSMGGFVAAAFHDAHPDRVAAVLLVDGGLPLPAVPEGMTADEAIAATIGPAAERLAMTFPDVGAYLDFWRRHPALGPGWSQDMEAYFAYDLVGEPPHCRSSVSLQAVQEDSRDLVDVEPVVARAAALPSGTVFLRAGHGMLGEPGGLYPADLMAEHARAFPQLDVRDVPGVNHYTLVMGSGDRVVSETVAEMGAAVSR